MKSDELLRVEKLSDWYLKEQLDFDKRLIRYRYETIKPKLVGKKCLELGPAEGEMTQFLIQDFEQLTVVEGSEDLFWPRYKIVIISPKFTVYLNSLSQSSHSTRLSLSTFWNTLMTQSDC